MNIDKIHYDTIVVFICLHITLPHYNHYADQTEGNERIQCLSGTFSNNYHAMYGAVRIQLTQFS